ncbi:hypothetical protein Poli38472_010466 [Pythium oligandrum]|uniref:Tudor domain-containing protein n=1 Tax=Pythium oligandrum TaxID=41045 RepID=A0A8K1C327_PYTOL|nr:hypothetical protein Poli38472_010466 [Pythium oligandrum]|eukprot:TMW55584.1 hypothetical protein Poli38472_010466 [Pythium oligandrum]
MSDASLEELHKRLATFTEQLESIHTLLQTDPENAEFLNIAQDLVEVIRLTKEMIDLKLNTKSTGGNNAVVTSGRADSTQEDEEETTTSSKEPVLGFAPGSNCEALSQNTWFPAHIESITANNTYKVQYLGFGNQDELPASSLRAIEQEGAELLPPKDEITVGFKCRAKYYVDGQYYTAAVTALTTYGFQVLFDGYGNSEEVPYEYFRPLPASSDASTTASAPVAVSSTKTAAVPALPSREAVIAKPIKVPENLQILPTDSEAEKERKRKRLKHINKLNKVKEIENERNIKQHDWRSFQNKAMKKGVKGSGVLSKRGSMFASPDTVQGRVGVVGSGHGMTAYEDTRKKAKRSHLEGSAPSRS